jgi:hypothetical protein
MGRLLMTSTGPAFPYCSPSAREAPARLAFRLIQYSVSVTET